MADKLALLADIGSTFTKVCAVDISAQILLGTASAPTTISSGIDTGLSNAIDRLFEKTGELTFSEKYACSSAAGGLRMIACGLVPELTAEAARLACLGAGAKLIKLYAYELTPEDISEIETLSPDIFLLTGGTDGGNSACILHNARMLSKSTVNFPILIAGNRSCAGSCEQILRGHETIRCENVMPKLGELNIGDVQRQIREVFLNRIVFAKGLTRIKGLVDGILMPTPAAIMTAAQLLAMGHENASGIGEILAVDLGGATTDVFSMSHGTPDNDSTILKGLPEPYAKRTVEGDLGMRYSAPGVLEAAGALRLAELAQCPAVSIPELVKAISERPSLIPQKSGDTRLDFAIAHSAIDIAVRRHAGTLEQAYTPTGPVLVQKGKNLRGISQMILTGGAVINSDDPISLAKAALAHRADHFSLLPRKFSVWVDKKYILSGMGLLAQNYPKCALAITKKELKEYGTVQQDD